MYFKLLQILEDNESVKFLISRIDLDDEIQLYTSTSRIEVTTNRSLFNMGIMIIKCKASIYSLWHRSIEEVFRDDSPQLAPVLGSTSSQSQIDEVLGNYR